MTKNKRKRVEDFLNTQKEILSIVAFEKKLGFSRGIIYKFIKYNRKLSREEINLIDSYVQSLIDNYHE